MGLCFAMFVFLMFRGPLASHDSNPYPNRSRIARYNATKIRTKKFMFMLFFSRAPRCGSGPNCPLERAPPPKSTGAPFPEATALPFPPPPSFPHHLGSFCDAQGGAAWTGVGEAAHGIRFFFPYGDPEGPAIEKIKNPDRNFQSRLEIFNPDRNFQSRSKISIPEFPFTGLS